MFSRPDIRPHTPFNPQQSSSQPQCTIHRWRRQPAGSSFPRLANGGRLPSRPELCWPRCAVRALRCRSPGTRLSNPWAHDQTCAAYRPPHTPAWVAHSAALPCGRPRSRAVMLSQRPLAMQTAFRGDDRAIFRDMVQMWETEPGQFFMQARLHAVEFAGAPPGNAGAFLPQPTVYACGHAAPRQPDPGPRYFYCKAFNGKLSVIETPPAVTAGESPMSALGLGSHARCLASAARSLSGKLRLRPRPRRLLTRCCRPRSPIDLSMVVPAMVPAHCRRDAYRRSVHGADIRCYWNCGRERVHDLERRRSRQWHAAGSLLRHPRAPGSTTEPQWGVVLQRRLRLWRRPDPDLPPAKGLRRHPRPV